MRFDIPVVGTIAHSWVMSYEDEMTAFRAYQRVFPNNAVFLIDTYDTLRAARRITETFRPDEVAGVRLDSGDLGELARGVRGILDGAGFTGTKILASGDLNEESIERLARSGAPIDAYGVGTDLTTVRDAPALGVVYKLVEIDRAGRREMTMKRSEGKSTYPGRKQVWRTAGRDGVYSGDVVTLFEETGPAGAVPLLRPVMRGGRRLAPPPPLDDLRRAARAEIERLPGALHGLTAPAEPYEVRFSERILEVQRELKARPV
jgi:nicotinate phosphoribosyltransferase